MRKTLPTFYNKDTDRVVCQVCKKELKFISNTHLRKHNLTSEEYKEQFKLWNGDLICQSTRHKCHLLGLKQSEEQRKRCVQLQKTLFKDFPELRGKIKKSYIREKFREMKFVNRESSIKALKKWHTTDIGRDAIDKSIHGRIKGNYLLCPECGKLFYRSPSRIRKINYCSYKCSAQNSTTQKLNDLQINIIKSLKKEIPYSALAQYFNCSTALIHQKI